MPSSILATSNRRLWNSVLDAIFYYIFSFILIFIIAFAGYSKVVLGGIKPFIFSYILFLAYYLVNEGIFGRTPAKYITKTKVVDIQGNKPSFKKILLRTILRFVPFEALTFLRKYPYGLHDSVSKTLVVPSSYSSEDVQKIDIANIKNEKNSSKFNFLMVAMILLGTAFSMLLVFNNAHNAPVRAKQSRSIPTEKWVSFSSNDGQFMALFPETPTSQILRNQITNIPFVTLNTYEYVWSSNQSDYGIVKYLYSDNTSASSSEVLNSFLSDLQHTMSEKHSLLISQNAFKYKDKYPALDFEFKGNVFNSKGRLIMLDDKTVYMIYGDYSAENNQSYDFFLNSFDFDTKSI